MGIDTSDSNDQWEIAIFEYKVDIKRPGRQDRRNA